MFYVAPNPKQEKMLIIADGLNKLPPDINRCEEFELFEDIPLQDYNDYCLIGIETEILQEELDNRRMLTDYLHTHPGALKVFKRIYI